MPLIFVCSDSDKMCQTLFTPALVSGHNLVSTHRLENFLSLRVSFYKLIDKLLFPSWWGDNCKFCFYSGITKTSTLKFSHHHIHQLSAVVVISTSQTVPWKDVFEMCLFQNWWHLVREAPLSEKCSFFEHCSNGGGGQPMFKNYVGNCRVFWRSFNNMKFAWKGTFEAMMVKFEGKIGTLYQIFTPCTPLPLSFEHCMWWIFHGNFMLLNDLQNTLNLHHNFWTPGLNNVKKTAFFLQGGIPKSYLDCTGAEPLPYHHHRRHHHHHHRTNNNNNSSKLCW